LKQSELSWRSYDGINIFGQIWAPPGEAKGIICLVHGLGEHSSRYAHLANYFLDSGFAVIASDLRGHGKSGGQKGHTPSYDHYCDEIELLIEKSVQLFPETPRFLYGHSMGGLLALYYIIQRQPEIKGAIITSPALISPALKSKITGAAIRILSLITPRFSVPNGIDPTTLSRDSVVGKTYLNDPLVHDKISARNLKEMLRTPKFIRKYSSEIKIPLLIMHGTADKITSIKGSEELAQIITTNCTYKPWDGYRHELHNELEKDQVYQYLVNWLNETM